MTLFEKEPALPRCLLRPLTGGDDGVRVMNLDGGWEVRHAPQDRDIGSGEPEGWEKISVPSDMAAQKNAAFTGVYLYRKRIFLPRDIARKRAFLLFSGANGFTRVFLDGVQIAEHRNGFVAFSAEASAALAGKESVLLNVLTDESKDRVSAFNHGGLIRSVNLYFLNECCLDGMLLTTRLVPGGAVLRAELSADGAEPGDTAELTAAGPQGSPDAAGRAEAVFRAENSSGLAEAEIFLPAPKLWDAEHPYLYRLRCVLRRGGRVLETAERDFGVREIIRRANRLFVNGREVKLRGVCRHEVTPRNGRAVPPELLRRDAELFREANCNYIRTSHYPPSEGFLDWCDRLGLYVEDEMDLAFVAKSSPYTQRDPAFRERYLSLFREVFLRDASHPSVLIWSIANEAFGGANYDAVNRCAHRLDPSRPTKFSYPMTMHPQEERTDLWSIHYANIDSDLGAKRDNLCVGGEEGRDVPVIYDEFAHIPCYNREELRLDPAVRNFWGDSLRLFWSRIWQAEGALGGAVWAGIDETNLFTPSRSAYPPERTAGDTCLEWGVTDIWRRKKPEFFGMRRAYAPVVPLGETCRFSGGTVRAELENRFCHTNLSEIRFGWRCGGSSGSLMGPDVPPRGTGALEISVPESEAGNDLLLTCTDSFGNHPAEYRLRAEGAPQAGRIPPEPADCGSVGISQSGTELTVASRAAEFVFSRETGLLLRGTRGGELLLTGGPELVTTRLARGPWKLRRLSAEQQGRSAAVTICGSYGEGMDVTFVLRIRPDGVFSAEYTVDRLSLPLPANRKLRVGVDCGGLSELGISFLAAPGMDSLSWVREAGAWEFPAESMSRRQGTAFRFAPGTKFGHAPRVPWKDEPRDYLLNGPYDVSWRGTADFRCLRENVRTASLFRSGGGPAVTVLSDGTEHVRVQPEEPEETLVQDRDPRVRYAGTWYREEDPCGCRGGTETVSREPGASAELAFAGTGVVWYGTADVGGGFAEVWVDGVLRDPHVSQKVNGVDFPGSAAGFDRKYGYPLYSAENLAPGGHILRIVVTGRKQLDSQNCYVGIDCFRILDGTAPEPVRLMVLSDFNFPQISWGNRKKPPVLLRTGSRGSAVFSLGGRPEPLRNEPPADTMETAGGGAHADGGRGACEASEIEVPGAVSSH